jgi:hypothetical protein
LAVSFILAGCDLLLGPRYTITYNANGATSGSAPIDSGSYRQGDIAIVLDEGMLARTDYTFEGWCLKADGSGTIYSPGDSLEIGGDDAILYAIWLAVPEKSLEDRGTVSLAAFNGRRIYSIVSAAPAAKLEANQAPTAKYSYRLKTADNAQNVAVPGAGRIASAAGRGIQIQPQARKDLTSRTMESRLLAGQSRQISRSAAARSRAAPASISVGTKWNHILVADANDSLWHVDTTCRKISDHAYFFIDDDDTAIMAPFLDTYGTAFDAIYHNNRAKFGEENDVDGNGKVIVVFSDIITDGMLGYFWSVDKFSAADEPSSNEGDIIYLTTDAEFQADVSDTILGTLAHEFQHMIYFDEHYDRNAAGSYAWLNEALSQAAEYYNGYLDNHLNWIGSFLLDYGSELSLTHWTSDNYGFGAIFIRYLIDQFGDAAIKNMCSTGKIGINAVETATGRDFNDIFVNFSRAVVMSGTGDSENSAYEFTTLDLAEVQPTGRGGLLPYAPATPFVAGDIINYWVYPYSLEFDRWHGEFGTMSVTGTSIVATAFGLSR